MSVRKYRYVYRSAITGRFVSKAIAKRWPNRTIRQRIALVAALLALAALCAGCGRERIVVRPEPVEVVRYVRAPIPAPLTDPIIVRAPEGLCWRDTARVLCNGQLADLALDYRAAIDQCNADRAALAEPAP